MDAYLLDTTVLSIYLDPTHPHHVEKSQSLSALPSNSPRFVSAIALAELGFGTRLAAVLGVACIWLLHGGLTSEVEQEACRFRGGAGGADDGPIILADDVQPGTEVIGVPDGRNDTERGADEGTRHLGDIS